MIRASEIPGVVATVVKNGRSTSAAAGFADLRARKRARPVDRFWIGSTTKTFVATVVLQLVGEGRLSLDDTVESRLPGLLKEGSRVRIRHLLGHRSGVPDYMRYEPWQSRVAANPRAIIPPVRLIASVADHLDFEPESSWEYSNTNYLILGELVERIEGAKIGTVLARRLFEPLGLRATAYESPGRGLRRGRMRGYELLGFGRPRDVTLHTLGGPWADGAIVSNARDLATFFGALLRGELLRPELLAEMKKVAPRSHGSGLGLFNLVSPCKPRTFFGNTGGTPGYMTFAAGSPDGRFLLVASVNGVGPSGIRAFGRLIDRLLCQ